MKTTKINKVTVTGITVDGEHKDLCTLLPLLKVPKWVYYEGPFGKVGSLYQLVLADGTRIIPVKKWDVLYWVFGFMFRAHGGKVLRLVKPSQSGVYLVSHWNQLKKTGTNIYRDYYLVFFDKQWFVVKENELVPAHLGLEYLNNSISSNNNQLHA